MGGHSHWSTIKRHNVAQDAYFFFNDTATTEIYTLSLHDALPISRRLAIDPTELRLRNLVWAEHFPYRTAPGIVWDRSGFVETLTSACDAIDYKKLRDVQKKARASGRLFGIGVATYAELTGIGSRISAAPGMPINTGTETATLRFDSTGAITGSFGTASHGQGLETTLAQVIANELGARIEDIRIVRGDSAAVAHGTGSYASRSAVLAGVPR